MHPAPHAFSALLSRSRLSEMLAPTISEVRNLDVNDVWRRVDTALSDAALLGAIRQAAWQSVLDETGAAPDDKQIQRFEKRIERRKRFKAASGLQRGEAPWLALSMRMDVGAGLASGEAHDLLATDDGAQLLRDGYALFGAYISLQLLGPPRA